MSRLDLGQLWHAVFGQQLLWWAMWFGLALLTVALLALMRTRWGQSQPLNKCLALSLLAHLLMAGYGTTVQIVHTTLQATKGHSVRITHVDGVRSGTVDDNNGTPEAQSVVRKPWDISAAVEAEQFDQPKPEREPEVELKPDLARPASEPLTAFAPASPSPPAVNDTMENVPADVAVDEASTARVAEPATELASDPEESTAAAESANATADTTTPVTAPRPDMPSADAIANESAHVNEGSPNDESLQKLVDVEGAATPSAADYHTGEVPAPVLPDEIAAAAVLTDVVRKPSGGSPRRPAPPESLNPATDPKPPTLVPAPYQQRIADRLQIAEHHGGSAETEDAVNTALRWLANHQNSDGRWEATRHGAGRELKVGGEDRFGAGAGADSGVTGLALLAMLGAGNTQLQGEHREAVRKGLEYLIAVQAGDGNLAGEATLFARMYCHAMATIAMGEAYGLTADRRLREPVRRAIAYTLAAQHPSTGGWRYQPREAGDTSQLGWQLMSLKSAELAQISVPQKAKDGITKFLQSVAHGSYGGLACYRPGEQTSRTMTAEALVCRQFLGMTQENPAGREAADYVLQELPGGPKSNLYYWYYATLGLYQLQGESWPRWNAALKTVLVNRQRKDGDAAGSWDTDDVWGGYGGRVYTTAMGTLCLEVYYRFLPLYGHAIAREIESKPLR